uniref:Protein kinase-like domain, concanavalin A-like lectin/glucanase domain protein n=1 Tax=Tanacetum cinerariifolium TaxID=118510 RepID=A0A699HQ72_TANCI|nr:protein kinase-like domain, concanavalin A-like lectin/glucanase domain protein [Tanacetum cinerariifolium]
MQTVAEEGVAGIKRRRHDLSSDGVRNLVTASGRGRLKEGNASSVERIPSGPCNSLHTTLLVRCLNGILNRRQRTITTPSLAYTTLQRLGDANPICTLGDYSKPSHEGYMNNIKLPVGNNVVPLRSDTIRLVQNGCSFNGLRSEDPNQHLKDFLKLMDSLDLDGENRERTQDLALYDNESWNNRRDFAKPVKEIFLPQDVPSTSDRRLIFVNSIVILNKKDKTKEEGHLKTSTTEYKDHEMTVVSEEEFREETEDEIKEKEDSPKHFNTFPTMKELRYHEWLLNNPQRLWVKAKVRTGNLNNIKFSCMIGHFDKNQAYLDMESPINVISRLHYNWIMSKRLGPRRKPSNPEKMCNFMGRVKGLKVFVRNFTYECDFMVLEDTTSVIDHDLGLVNFGKPFVEAPVTFTTGRKEQSHLRKIRKRSCLRCPMLY